MTIATNMAGRGTDIMLGGSWQAEVAALENPTPEQIEKIKADWQVRHDAVLAAGGLHIIGTERHESRRIDNQLRGRAGRQGDAGSSRFYLSMEDALMRIFASDRVSGMMRKLGMKPGEAIEHPWVTKAIANAQRKVESRNFDIRKQLLEYDDVDLEFTEDALNAIADKAIERNIGARGLRAVMEGLLTKVMYEIPSDETVVKAVVTKECVEGTAEPELTHDPDKINYSVKLNPGRSESRSESGTPKSAS